MRTRRVGWALLLLLLTTTVVSLSPMPVGVRAQGSEPIGYRIEGGVVEIWNPDTTYYFNKSSGVQWTEDPEQYWTRNIFAIEYYAAGGWHKIYSADELGTFNREIDSDYETYVNATLWKDFTYAGYELRLGVRYHLKLGDTELSVIIYAKNRGAVDFPYPLGFDWMVTDIDIPNPNGKDTIFINGTDYRLDGVYDLSFTNMSHTYFDHELNETVTEFDSHYRIFDWTEFITLDWDKNVPYTVRLQANGVQSEASVTWMVNAGIFQAGQEKFTTLYWADAEGDYTGDHWDISSQGSSIGGITTDGEYIWIVDYGSDEVYKYSMTGSYLGSWDTSGQSGAPYGITTDGLYIWIVDSIDDEVYRYSIAGVYDNSWDISTQSGNSRGITTDGVYIWVFDATDDEIYKYEYSLFNEAPNAPSLTSPANGTRFNLSESVSFTWSFDDPDDGDTQGAYQIQLDNNSDFSSPEVDSNKVSSSSESTNRNLPSSVDAYYWRVKPWDDSDAEGPWSSVRYVISDRFEIVSVAFDGYRVDVWATAEVRYVLHYAYEDVLFTGSDGSIVGYTWNGTNSWWYKSVTAPSSPGYDNYDENDLGAITDSNYGLTALEDDAGANLIGDDLNVTDFWASNYSPLTGEDVALYAKFESLYDFHICDGDDSITIEELPFTYDPIEEWFYVSIGKNESGTHYFDTLNSIYENTYNTTSGQMDFNISITWFDYTVELGGLYYENGTYADNVTVNAHFIDSLDTFTLDHNETKEYTNGPIMISWELEGGGARMFYPISNNETYYLFTPFDDYMAYSFSIHDYAGQIGSSDSYLEAYSVINNTERLIERNQIWDVLNPTILVLQKDRTYRIQIRCGTGAVYSFGYFIPTAGPPPTLIIDKILWEDTLHPVSEYISVEISRPAYTHIRVNYKDELEQTTSIFLEIRLRNGTQVWNYTSLAQMVQINWYGANNETEYVAFLSATHEVLGYITVSKTLLGETDPYAPPDFSVIGVGPSLLSVFIIVLVAGSVSRYNRSAGMFAGAAIASVLTYVNFVSIPYEVLAVAFALSILSGLGGR